MKLIDRYLFRQLLVPLLYCLSAIFMLIIIWDLFDHFSDFMAAHSSMTTVLRYYAAVLAAAVEYVLPSCLLLATLYALWEMTRSNEIIALRSSGISLYRIMCPFLAVGLFATGLSALIKETYAPHAAEWATGLSQNRWVEPPPEILTHHPYYNEISHRQWYIDLLDTHEPGTLHGVTVRQERPDHSPDHEIGATQARWMDGVWWFWCTNETSYNEQGVASNLACEIVKAMPDLNEHPSDFLAGNKAGSSSDDFKTSRELLDSLRIIRPASQGRAEVVALISRRLAMPWACFIVTLFAIPAGNKGSRQSPINGILMAMLFFLSYYALLQLGSFLGTRQILPPSLGPWLSNIVFALAGLFMLFKTR